MRIKLTIILGSLVGAFSVYGAQVAVRGSVAPSARGQAPTCCTQAPPSFVKLAEGDLNATTTPLSTAPIAVRDYTELVLYVNADVLANVVCFPSCCPMINVPQFRPDASTPFGSTGQFLGQLSFGGRVRVDGSDMILSLSALDSNCNHANYHYVVAGVQ